MCHKLLACIWVVSRPMSAYIRNMKLTGTGMRLRHWNIAAAGIMFAALPLTAFAGAAPEEALSVLQKRGYTAVKIKPSEKPGYEASACKSGTRFAITMDREINIIDVDPRGTCGKQQQRYAAAPSPHKEYRQGDGGYKGGGFAPPPGYAPPAYGGPPPTSPEVIYAPILERLYRKGFYNLRIKDVDDDEIEVLGCKHRRLYEIEVRLRNGRIDDIDKRGRCGPRPSARYGTHVDAPYANVRTGRGNVDVQAPFTGVHVGRSEVHIRAPFVDLRIPK